MQFSKIGGSQSNPANLTMPLNLLPELKTLSQSRFQKLLSRSRITFRGLSMMGHQLASKSYRKVSEVVKRRD